ncbi:MAG: dihydropyrimidinase, partial [Chloroflexi bacterium]|nr:dihydropyrimidinase [Chloroflexota bacterium]
MDVIVKGGTIVTASDQYIADIGVEGEQITRIGQSLRANGARVVDATGMYVIPGAIDAHTHLDMPFGGTVTSDDFETGQIAAACGGTTTHVDYCLQSVGGTLHEALATWRGKAQGKAVIDYGFHLAVTDLNANVMAELPAMVNEGITSFKCFMAYKGVFQIDDATLFQLLEQARELGALVNVHAENGDVVDLLTKRLISEGMTAPRYHAASRPLEVEAEATHRAVALAELARAPLNVVHMTCEASVRHVNEARAKGLLDIHGETCPQYLLLNVDQYDEPDFQGAKYVMSPPLRDRKENAFLWRQLAAGNLETLMTDHCSFRMRDQKSLGKDNFAKIPNGIPGIETRVPIVFSEGVGKGRISLQTMVATMSTNPARMYGLYPKKGCIAVGSDADIVLIDPKRRVVLSASTL